MKKLIILLVLLASCTQVNEKIFVANEVDGSISVIDATTLKEIDLISLETEHDGALLKYMPHNVQVAGNKVLVTANVEHKEEMNHDEEMSRSHNMSEMQHEMKASIPKISFGIVAVEAHGEEEASDEHPDQLVVIDAKSHKILNRIDLEEEAHLAHVVSYGQYAYVTATDTEVLYKVNLETGRYSPIILPKGSMPHGIRLTEDGKTAIIAAMGNAMLIMNLDNKKITTIELPGKGVQTGIAGNIAMASVFDTKQLALYDLSTEKLSFVDLPDAKGPIQMYPTPDGKYVYVADQGVYFDQPPGTSTYKIDLAEGKVDAIIETGNAPHGVVVSPDGRVWVTNLNGNTVSVIKDDKKIAEIEVGKMPNGISYWSAQ